MFEKFRNNSSKIYGLFTNHYLSAPGASCNAMLKMTKIELELIPDPGMYIFFEKGTGGRTSYISNRYCKDNNKYLKSYEPKQKSKHVISLDMNNLYGMNPKEFDLNKYSSNRSKRCALEVDLEYPKDLR